MYPIATLFVILATSFTAFASDSSRVQPFRPELQLSPLNCSPTSTVYLVGEDNHYDPRQSSIRDESAELGRSNSSFTMLEGLDRGHLENSKYRLFGLEDRWVYSISVLEVASSVFSILSQAQQPLDAKALSLKAIGESGLKAGFTGLSDIWSKMDRPFAEDSVEKLARYLDSMEKKADETRAAQSKVGLSESLFLDGAFFMGASGDKPAAVSALIQALVSRTKQEMVASHRYKYLDSSNFDEKSLVGVGRNLEMASSILKLYCSAASMSLPLYIHVGQAHISGMHQLLSQFLPPATAIYELSAAKLYEEAKSRLDAIKNTNLIQELKLQLPAADRSLVEIKLSTDEQFSPLAASITFNKPISEDKIERIEMYLETVGYKVVQQLSNSSEIRFQNQRTFK